jgi:CRP/FNR family transcriptional regulator
MDNRQIFIPNEPWRREFPTYLMNFPHEVSALEKFGSIKKLPKNTVLIKPGEVPKYCYLLKTGCIVAFEYISSGDERVYNIMMPGSLILESNLIFNEPVPIFFKTIKSSALICIDRATLLKAMNNDFNVVTNVIQSLSYKFMIVMDMMRETRCHDAMWRVCNLLLKFAENFGVPYEDKILIKEKISQQLLSDILGVTRITVYRIVKKLADMDLIVQINSYYCICNTENLKKHMDYLEH